MSNEGKVMVYLSFAIYQSSGILDDHLEPLDDQARQAQPYRL